MIRSPLVRRTGLARGGIKPVSDKRRRQCRTYTRLRREFLADRPCCEFPTGCQNAATDVHHKAGRVGAMFLDVGHWVALCRSCHDWAGRFPAAAYELGVSERRVSADCEVTLNG